VRYWRLGRAIVRRYVVVSLLGIGGCSSKHDGSPFGMWSTEDASARADAGDAPASDVICGAPDASGDDAGRDAGAAGAALLAVLETPGCGVEAGMEAGKSVRETIETEGIKPAGCADSVCGPWAYARDYVLTLPAGYDATHAYDSARSVTAAIDRAMSVDGCPCGATYATATFAPFPFGPGDQGRCRRITGCSDLAPLVVCAIPGTYPSGNDALANPGFSSFLRLFEQPPLHE
jgi:hypothetical protein